MEYTICSLVACAVAGALDRVLGVRVLRRRSYWLFVAIIFAMEFLVNGYLTARPVVQYGEGHYLGVRVFTIPVEDFLYGWAFVTMVVVTWESLRARET